MPGLFGSNGGSEQRNKGSLPPTQAHIPVSAVQDDVAIIRLRINKVPTTILTAILEIGAVDITRMSPSERSSFIARYTEALRGWRFPRQIIIGRRRQDLAGFLARGAEQIRHWQQGGDRNRADLLGRLLDFMEQVTVLANPQVPVYYLTLPYLIPATPAQGGRVTQAQYREGLQALADRTRIVQRSLNQLGLGVVRLDDQAIVDLLYAFYHPSLPVLWLSPQERIASLLVAGDESFEVFVQPNPSEEDVL